MASSSSNSGGGSSSLYYGQQRPQTQTQLLNDETEPAMSANVAAAAAAAAPNRYSSGSIGPLFAVLSVLVVLAVLSCFLGRICARARALTVADDPIEMIKGGGVRGWLRRKWRRCVAGDVEAGAKVADCCGKETPRGSDEAPQA